MKALPLSSLLTALALCLAGGLMAEAQTLNQAPGANGQGAGGGLSLSLQAPTSEFTVPTHLQTVSSTGEIATVEPWFPATLVLNNGSSRDIEVHWLGEPRVIFTLSNAAGDSLWTNAASPEEATVGGGAEAPIMAAVDGRIAKSSQLRETGKIPLTHEGTPLPTGTYALEARLNADKAYSTRIFFNVASLEVPRVDTGIAGSVVQVNGDGSNTGAKASLQLMEVLPTGAEREPHSRSGASDASGKFSLIGIFPGTYRLSVTTATAKPGQGASDTISVTVTEGQIQEVGALRLTQVPLSSTGAMGHVVKAAPTGADPEEVGAKAILSFVEIVPSGVSRGAYARSGETDAEGQFRISGFFPGTYRVTAFPPAGSVGLAASEASTVMIEVGRFNEVGPLKLRMVGLPATAVDGTVHTVDAVGKEIRVPGASVQLLETDAQAPRIANRYTSVTGSDGRFVLGVAPGNYAITVSKTTPASDTAPATVRTGTGSVIVMANARVFTRITLIPKTSK